MRRSRVTGGLLVASGVLSIGGYLVLGTQFGWPAVLDEPGTTALDAFVEVQAWVRFGFYLFLLSSLVLIPAAIGLLDEFGADSTAARSVAAFGVLGAFAQMLGWVRWPIAVPGLAEAWTDEAATATQREATTAAYDVLNGYAGGALGEHLGWLLQGIWGRRGGRARTPGYGGCRGGSPLSGSSWPQHGRSPSPRPPRSAWRPSSSGASTSTRRGTCGSWRSGRCSCAAHAMPLVSPTVSRYEVQGEACPPSLNVRLCAAFHHH